jgi:hypothetical protein
VNWTGGLVLGALDPVSRSNLLPKDRCRAATFLLPAQYPKPICGRPSVRKRPLMRSNPYPRSAGLPASHGDKETTECRTLKNLSP